MAKEKVVVAKRGCTCCGTGCVLVTAAVPGGLFLLWQTAGLWVALAAWPVGLAGAHGVRFVKRRRVTA